MPYDKLIIKLLNQFYYMTGTTSGEMERSDWLRRSDRQSLLSRNGPVHYGFWFASANV